MKEPTATQRHNRLGTQPNEIVSVDELKGERVLILAPYGRDSFLLGMILARAGLHPQPFQKMEDLCRAFEEGAGAALIAIEALSPPAIRQLVNALSKQPPWSHLPVVILTYGSEPTAVDLTILQALDPYSKTILLERPLHVVTLVSAVQTAVRARRRQYEIRDYLLERERQANALHERELQLRLITDALPVLIAYVDTEQRYQFNNAAYERWFGVCCDAIKGRHLRDVLGEAAYHAIEGYGQAALAGQALSWERELPYRDGSSRYVHADYVPHRDADGQIRGYYSIIVDITEQKRVEAALRHKSEQLAEADRLKNVFLAVLGHELRNPLGSIQNAIEVLKLHPADATVDAHMREIVQRQVSHLARLVDDLLDVSRIDRGKLVVHPQRLDLLQLVSETIASEHTSIQAAGLGLEVRLPKGPLWVDADPTRLAQVIGNLLSNAKKFTPAGGRVDIEVSANTTQATVAIRDTGCGIDPQVIAHLFNPFISIDISPYPGGAGLGLGLPIAKGLIEAHGGYIEAFSQGLGQGAEFSLHIPLQPAPARQRPAPTPGHGADQQRILVIDDQHDSAEALAELLTLYGHRVEVAFDGPGALEAARRFHPDVVICDIGLPGMDGYQVAQALRSDPHTAAVRLFALTGYGDKQAAQRACTAGFDQWLTKPVDLARLNELLTRSPSPE